MDAFVVGTLLASIGLGSFTLFLTWINWRIFKISERLAADCFGIRNFYWCILCRVQIDSISYLDLWKRSLLKLLTTFERAFFSFIKNRQLVEIVS